MTDNGYKYEEYSRALEKILDSASKDYWVQYVDINRHQVGVAKTYLWVSAALLGGYVGAFRFFGTERFAHTASCVAFSVVALVLVIASFGLCMYAIPARTGYRLIAPKSWGEFSQQAHTRLNKKEPNLYIATLTELIDRTDTGSFHNLKTNKSRAKLLRVTSWLLIGSFVAAVAATAFMAAANIRLTSADQEVVMADENQHGDDASSGQGAVPPAPADKPQVPTPQGPLGSGDPNVHTHSVDTETGSVSMIEGVDSKSDK